MAADLTARPPPDASRVGDERYHQLVELSPDAIFVHDDGLIVLANAAAARLAGAAQPEELHGLPIAMFLEPPYLKSVQNHLKEFGSPADVAAPFVDTFRRLDGSEVQVEVRAVAILDRGRAAAHLIVRDITMRVAAEQAAREMEAQLHQARRLESVGLLAGGVAHEVNNMMAVILGLSDFLLGDARLSEVFVSEVREIATAADRAAMVSRQLLSFSRRAVHRPRIVDLAVVIRDIEPLVRRLLAQGQRLVIAPGPESRAMADPEQLEEIILNLSLNARDAMTTGGTLTIMTTPTTLPGGLAAVDLGEIPPGSYAMIRVHDTGVGIEPAIQERIFEPFFTTSPVGQRTGLGLAAVFGAVTQNKGYITVASTPGFGATFTVYLPLLPAAEVKSSTGVPLRIVPASSPAGAVVMVVDDEPAVLSVVARRLERGGFQVIAASSGAEALALIERLGAPQVVLTDLIMPEMDGTALATQLRERWPALPIIFMSGFTAKHLEISGAIGPNDVLLQKPFGPGDLLASVNAALAGIGA